MFFCKRNVSQFHLKKALHDPWCPLFPFRRVSLAEYILVLKVLFPLVAGCDVSWLLQELDDSCHSGGV
jgi:hypothetical protein